MKQGEQTQTRKRTQARELALQLLYQYDIQNRAGGAQSELDLSRAIEESADDPEVREFCQHICFGALESLETSDRLISEVVDNWRPERIAAIDRAILRLAVFELNEMPEVPAKVVLNEAIELAKKFSTAQSGGFVNGILDQLLVLRNAAAGSGTAMQTETEEENNLQQTN